MFLLRKASDTDALQSGGLKLPRTGPTPIDGRLVVGAAIFGVGWGLGGFCPGPALANLGALRIEALVYVPTMTIGMLLAQRFCGADRDTRLRKVTRDQ
jgi:uncharacterized membrane protein YedE/YeeE